MDSMELAVRVANDNRDKARAELVVIGRAVFGKAGDPSTDEIERLAQAALTYIGRARAAELIERKVSGAKHN